jgi:hypothetical protein
MGERRAGPRIEPQLNRTFGLVYFLAAGAWGTDELFLNFCIVDFKRGCYLDHEKSVADIFGELCAQSLPGLYFILIKTSPSPDASTITKVI